MSATSVLRDPHETATDNLAQPRGSLRVTLPTIGYRFLLPIVLIMTARFLTGMTVVGK